PEISDDLPDLLYVERGLARRADVGLGNDFDERHPAAVEIQQRLGGMLIVQRFAGILFHVDARDADPPGGLPAVIRFTRRDLDKPTITNRGLVLRDLIAFRQIRVEIMLTRED